MGCCSGRCMLMFFCALQLITSVERQVFDFLGYQWAPILVNFLHVIVVILGLFGTVQYKPRYIVLYIVWMVFWVTWNVFICCLYLDLGGLSKDSNYLSLGLSSYRSWWKDNGPGCENRNLPTTRWQHLESPALVSELGCVLEYQYIEVMHSALQVFFSALGFVFACYVVNIFNEEEDAYLYK
ncbi:sodium/potassium-transporting ATPase subunit beta-1-interacting protein 3 isoform X1 [Sinocyclocheilus grahami]|uniref:Sodium/potassium-transporting ATPase subunit beta-1-interacting protein n=1 Tax=Sinocyclocheilus grahami TaxID=75366 RepID=A0A672L8N5_SINGR|nr:PREDICTED: sodium/potassium-transporting ATPase subunit beta-1-interacting protein 3-like isoform X1 [Sinocyclocheilus grahami]